MGRFIGLLAFIGFILSLIIHLSTFFGPGISVTNPLTLALHLGLFVVFIPFIISARRSVGRRMTLSVLREILPSWAVLAMILLFVYAVINFLLLFMGGLETGTPIARGFSGHWLVFYFTPFVYFMFGKIRR